MPGSEPNVAIATRLSAPAHAVWARATSPEGINEELRPILRMTRPRGMNGTSIDDVRVGEALGRSWILLLGFLPVDWDDIVVAELVTGGSSRATAASALRPRRGPVGATPRPAR
jgi:hypothetical protein